MWTERPGPRFAMNTSYLIEYIYLAETLNFKRTADYFYVSKSVISRHLAALEEAIGTKLIERGGQTAHLTEAGKVFYREAQTVLRAYANAVDRTRAVSQTDSRPIRIGYLKNAARPVIVHFVRYMNHEHPSVQLDVTCMDHSELRHALEEGTVDIALAVNINPSVSRNYRSTAIYTDQFFAIISKDHPAAHQSDSISIEQLCNEKLLLPDSFAYAGLSELADKLVESQAQAANRAYYHDVDELYLKVQAEGYVAFSSGLNNVMFGDRLAIMPITGVDSSFRVSAFYSDQLPSDAFAECRKGFESCQASMKTWNAAQEGDAIGFSLGIFE